MPPSLRPPRHLVAAVALAGLAACADAVAPARHAALPTRILPLRVDSIDAPARVVAGDSVRVTLHGACAVGEAVEWTGDATHHAITVYDVPHRRGRRAGCAPLVVAIATQAPSPWAAPPLAAQRLTVAVRLPGGDSLTRAVTVAADAGPSATPAPPPARR